MTPAAGLAEIATYVAAVWGLCLLAYLLYVLLFRRRRRL